MWQSTSIVACFGLVSVVACVLLVVAIYEWVRKRKKGKTMRMAWMRKRKKRRTMAMTMTWKRIERGMCGAWCVCALLCCVASGSTEDREGGSERQKSTLYTGKYKN